MNPTSPLSHLRYFLQDEIYLLNADKASYQHADHSLEKPNAEPKPVIEETPVLDFKYMGGNQKHFLTLCHYPGSDNNMAEAHLAALKSTLSRLGFELQDIAILNLAHYTTANWPQLAEWFKPEKLLILGSESLPANLSSLVFNQIQNIDNTNILYTFSFNEMMGNKENTKVFWNVIKTL